MRAELKVQESPVPITINPKTKFSSSTFGSQAKKLGLLGSAILSGNSLDVSVTSQSKVFDKVEVVHSNQIEAKFYNKPAGEFESVLFTHSGAATIQKGGIFNVYDCNPTAESNFCSSVKQDEQLKVDFDQILSQASFGNTEI